MMCEGSGCADNGRDIVWGAVGAEVIAGVFDAGGRLG